jgi:hypothetical protein
MRDVDVFLDTIEWSACNTTLEALAHGVPVVTLPGRRRVLRVAAVRDLILLSGSGRVVLGYFFWHQSYC